MMAPVHLNTGSHADSFAFTSHAQSPSGNSINFTFKRIQLLFTKSTITILV